MKILIKNIRQKIKTLKSLDIASLIIAILLIIPVFNFLLEGFSIILSGDFSLGIAGKEEVIGTLKLLIMTSFFGGGLGIINGWLLSNC